MKKKRKIFKKLLLWFGFRIPLYQSVYTCTALYSWLVAAWPQYCQQITEDDGNCLAPSFLLVSINVRKQGPLKIISNGTFFSSIFWSEQNWAPWHQVGGLESKALPVKNYCYIQTSAGHLDTQTDRVTYGGSTLPKNVFPEFCCCFS